ncbi:MAG: hypothetical protein K2Y56_11580 [Methylobacterium sp.]|uniref:hypothetical protein n=1 Tax=Methylobacterium sp. TaxID=409 RepID=UPI0025FFF8A8|nr:hypothetical protein [Methylobacterium sp.]MBX9932161.1 hypothetical protein [Methylobacterium sp.]
MCSVSFALGRWRAERNKPLRVALATTVCQASYEEGFAKGRAGKRNAGPRR